eukprot:5193772-Amphidinium_carterae.1
MSNTYPNRPTERVSDSQREVCSFCQRLDSLRAPAAGAALQNTMLANASVPPSVLAEFFCSLQHPSPPP